MSWLAPKNANASETVDRMFHELSGPLSGLSEFLVWVLQSRDQDVWGRVTLHMEGERGYVEHIRRYTPLFA